MFPLSQSRTDASQKHRILAILLGTVLLAGVVSFLLRVDAPKATTKEEFQFVAIAPPTPPPPPPTPEPPEPDPETVEEPIEPLDAPQELQPATKNTGPDLGIDLGDLALGEGGTGGFLMEIPKFGVRGAIGGDGDEDPLSSGGAAEPPVPTLKPQPNYPSSLLRKNIGGKVIVSVTVDADGSVSSASIKTSSGHQELDDAAIHAARKWKFKPGTRGGKPAKSVCVIPYSFNVKNS